MNGVLYPLGRARAGFLDSSSGSGAGILTSSDPSLLIGRMVSHRFLEQFVGQTGQQQTLQTCSTKSPRPFLMLALVLDPLSLGVTTSMIWAQDPKRNINKNELRRNDTYVRTQECSL